MNIQITNTFNASELKICSATQWTNFIEDLIHDLFLYMTDVISIQRQQETVYSNHIEDKQITEAWKNYHAENDCTTIKSFRYMIESNRDFLSLLVKFHVNGLYSLVFYDETACFSTSQTKDILLALTSILSFTEKDDTYRDLLEQIVDYLQHLDYNMDFQTNICYV
jgi:hypothetical protein